MQKISIRSECKRATIRGRLPGRPFRSMVCVLESLQALVVWNVLLACVAGTRKIELCCHQNLTITADGPPTRFLAPHSLVNESVENDMLVEIENMTDMAHVSMNFLLRGKAFGPRPCLPGLFRRELIDRSFLIVESKISEYELITTPVSISTNSLVTASRIIGIAPDTTNILRSLNAEAIETLLLQRMQHPYAAPP